MKAERGSRRPDVTTVDIVGGVEKRTFALARYDPLWPEDYLEQLLQTGYHLRVREPGHRMVRTPACDVHVHVMNVGDEAADDYLLSAITRARTGRTVTCTSAPSVP